MGKVKILFVDDELKSLKLFSRLLSELGFLIQTAADGNSALIKAEKFQPKIVLLDVRMPYGGLGLVDEIKKLLPESIIIMVSAFIEPIEKEDFLNAGAYACLDKPVKLEDMISTIKNALKA